MELPKIQGVTNVHLSNVHFVLRDISQQRGEGGKEGMEVRREVVKAKNLAENKVHV